MLDRSEEFLLIRLSVHNAIGVSVRDHVPNALIHFPGEPQFRVETLGVGESRDAKNPDLFALAYDNFVIRCPELPLHRHLVPHKNGMSKHDRVGDVYSESGQAEGTRLHRL
jgi:hypothetical protein